MKKKEVKKEMEHLMAQLDCLKNNINPHFLFNSFSILASLVRVDPGLSEEFIDHMSRTYRYTLEKHEHPLVSLQSEIDFIRSYTFLLKIRFSDKFEVRLNIPELDLSMYMIPPLTLQILIENAVKHNRMSVTDPLVIEIFIADEMLVVKNEMKLRSHADKNAIGGLQNIVDRYAGITDRLVWAGETEDHFVVQVPLIHQNQSRTQPK